MKLTQRFVKERLSVKTVIMMKQLTFQYQELLSWLLVVCPLTNLVNQLEQAKFLFDVA